MEDFWTFSLRVWRMPGLEEACLDLQDKFKADINIVLFCLYTAEWDVLLDGSTIKNLDAETLNWRQQIILPLRRIRKAIRPGKDQNPELYKNIQAAELSAEEWAQKQMDQNVSKYAKRDLGEKVGHIAAQSLKNYLIDFLENDSSVMEKYIDVLISICFPAPHYS